MVRDRRNSRFRSELVSKRMLLPRTPVLRGFCYGRRAGVSPENKRLS